MSGKGRWILTVSFKREKNRTFTKSSFRNSEWGTFYWVWSADDTNLRCLSQKLKFWWRVFWSLKIYLFRSVATSDFMIHLLYAFFVSKSHKIEHHGNIQDRVSKCGRIKLALKLCYYLMTYVISITLEVETN